MRSKEAGERVAKVCVSIPASMARKIDEVINLDDPLAPNRSMIIQAALRDWLEANVEEYASYDENGEPVLKTRLKKDQQPHSKEGQPMKRRYEDVMDPFDGAW